MIAAGGFTAMAWKLAQRRVFSGVAYPPSSTPKPREHADKWACSREYYRILDRANDQWVAWSPLRREMPRTIYL